MDFISQIVEIIEEKTCIVGVGNYIRRDDAVGLYIVDEMKRSIISDRLTVLNVEDIIESYVFEIAERDCSNVIIIDAVKSDSSKGTVLFGRINEFNEIINNYSTHKLSLLMSGRILEKSGKKTYLLGIVVEDVDIGVGLSKGVRRSADIIKDLLIKTINCNRKEYVYEH